MTVMADTDSGSDPGDAEVAVAADSGNDASESAPVEAAAGPASDAPEDISVAEPGDGAFTDGSAGDGAPGDGSADAAPPPPWTGFDAGEGLLTLDQYPTWSLNEDHDGFSCSLVRGPLRESTVTVPLGVIVIGLYYARRRRRQR